MKPKERAGLNACHDKPRTPIVYFVSQTQMVIGYTMHGADRTQVVNALLRLTTLFGHLFTMLNTVTLIPVRWSPKLCSEGVPFRLIDKIQVDPSDQVVPCSPWARFDLPCQK